MQDVLTAPVLYAMGLGQKTEGTDECYWCAGPTIPGRFPHYEPAPTIARQWPIGEPRPRFLPRRPGNGCVCVGCHLWRRKLITVRFLDNKNAPALRDRQTPPNHSWLLTKADGVAVRPNSGTFVYPTLLKPPNTFCLMLREGESVPNHLHCGLVNDIAEIKADTPLHFTLNNIPHTYTVYELEAGLRGGKEGTLPGVAALIRLFGECELPPSPEDKRQQVIAGKPKGGRPEPLQDGKVLNRPVTMSGKF
jgi:hypothetical protein